jgi:hypothetical protein
MSADERDRSQANVRHPNGWASVSGSSNAWFIPGGRMATRAWFRVNAGGHRTAGWAMSGERRLRRF